jgi:2-polyprenyl-6-methoxyphenol hydroxylase-like FAD-dependent oxidoreductase
VRQTWRESIIKQCSETEASKFGAIVKNSSFAGPGVVLVGDAAHSVTSTLGQGCCLGLSGMKALAAAVDSATV